MNTIITEEDFTLIAPDMAIMSSASRLLNNHAKSLQLEFLGAMAEKLPYLQLRLSTAESVFREKLASLLAQLANSDLSSISQKQQEIDASDKLAPEQKQQATLLLDRQRILVVSTVIASIKSSSAAIAKSTDDLHQVDLELADNRLRDTLQRQRDEETLRNDELNLRLNEINEERRKLDETIKTYEEYTAFDFLKDQLPTAEQLLAFGAKTPDVALIQAGLDRLAKNLDKLSDALTYLDLTQERDRLRTDYNTLRDKSREQKRVIDKLVNNLNELVTLASVQQNKNVWVLESRKVYESLNRFLDAHDDEAQMSLGFSQSLEKLQAYILSFYTIQRNI